MFELKDYQIQALEAFSRWREVLDEAAKTAQQLALAVRNKNLEVPTSIGDWPQMAWQRLADAKGVAATSGNYVSRSDEAGRPIPHVCLKVPTGGGKTLLAAGALERLGRPTGLTLWITPTRAIYEQTRTALKKREHPYREILERASGGRVKILEKDDHFAAGDIANYLCIMLLMLPAANRFKEKAFLRMFRDSGRYPSFFPNSDDKFSNDRLLRNYPDLEQTLTNGPAKQSLFNVFKMIRPVVVLDEAHKAYGKRKTSGEEFARSISRLDPSLVIELSATPNSGVSNLLVDIGGVALKSEEMIKLPVQVEAFSNADWRDTLSHAYEELLRLESEAESLRSNEGRYIRPIAVVRVERTGRHQRDGIRVHAEDVREYLIRNLSVSFEAIAVKSSEQDELAGVDLLSDYCPVRWVVTKSALMEGWDCPFAYILVMLDNVTAMKAITQLVGRVMRQPHAQRTGREALDRCYVYCWNISVGQAVEHVKAGLEEEGLTGLSGQIQSTSEGSIQPVTIKRRPRFQEKEIFLPLVLHRDGANWRELDYTRDILSNIDWDEIGAPEVGNSLAQAPVQQSVSVDIGDVLPTTHVERTFFVDKTIRLAWFARQLSDIVPNPWQAARIGKCVIDSLREAGRSDEAIYDRRSFVRYELRKHLNEEIERSAEFVFREKIRNGEIRFDLDSGQPNFCMTASYKIAVPDGSGHMTREDRSTPLQLSLFEPTFVHEFDNDLERGFARYLDEHRALQWWHRIAVRQGGEYYLKGWREHRIWPDFVAIGTSESGKQHLLVFETKGSHLDGSDTEYKKRVLEALEDAFECGSMTVHDGPVKGVFKLVFSREEFPSALADI